MVAGVGDEEVEQISNGSFEGALSPWVLQGNASGMYHYSSTAAAHSGSGYMYSAGIYKSANIRQDVTIPNVSSASLTYWLKAAKSGAGTSSYLYRVRVYSANGTLLQTLASYNDSTLPFGSYQRQGPFDLSAYKGQTIRLYFIFWSGGNNNTRISLDDVSLKTVTNYNWFWWPSTRLSL